MSQNKPTSTPTRRPPIPLSKKPSVSPTRKPPIPSFKKSSDTTTRKLPIPPIKQPSDMTTRKPPIPPKPKARAPVIYNPKSEIYKSLALKKNPNEVPKSKSKAQKVAKIKAPRSRKEISQFLREREKENDDTDDLFGYSGSMVGRFSKRSKLSKSPTKSGKKSKKRKSKQGPKEEESSSSEDTLNVVQDVAKDLEKVGVESTKENSKATIPRKKRVGLRKSQYKEPKTLAEKIQALFARKKTAHELVEKPSIQRPKKENKDTEEIRQRLVRKYRRRDRCTYAFLVIVVVIRLITTVEMVWEHEDYYMVLEDLKRKSKLNCLEILGERYIRPWAVVLFFYFISCCILPIITKKHLSSVCVVWLFTQMVYSGIRSFLLQAFIYHSNLLLPKSVMLTWLAHSALDILSFITIMLRYYFIANPCAERDRYSNTMLGSNLVNENIQFMVQSSFIRKKLAVQRATALQIMSVVKTIKGKIREGKHMDPHNIHKEVRSAIHALEDWKKFAALRIIHAYEAKEKAMREKLRLRRRRIREMKAKFRKMRVEARKRRGKTRGSIVNTLIKYTSEDKRLHLNRNGIAKPGSSKSFNNKKGDNRRRNVSPAKPRPSTVARPMQPRPEQSRSVSPVKAAGDSGANKTYAQRRAALRNQNK